MLMHGSDYDIRVLDRDYDTRIRGLVDTQIMAQVLGEPKTGLAALLEKEEGVVLDKRHQRADWGRRPLTRSQVAYAAADTAFLGSLGRQAPGATRGTRSLGVGGGRVSQARAGAARPGGAEPSGVRTGQGGAVVCGATLAIAPSLFSSGARARRRRLDVPPFKVLGSPDPRQPRGEAAEERPRISPRCTESVPASSAGGEAR